MVIQNLHKAYERAFYNKGWESCLLFLKGLWPPDIICKSLNFLKKWNYLIAYLPGTSEICTSEAIAGKVTSNPPERIDLGRESYNCKSTSTIWKVQTQSKQSYNDLVCIYFLCDTMYSSKFQIIFRFFGLRSLNLDYFKHSEILLN